MEGTRWSPEMAQVARSVASRARRDAWMYERMAAHHKRWGDAITIASGVLTGMVGVESLVDVFGESRAPLALRAVAMALSFLALVLITLDKAWQPKEAGFAAQVAQCKLLGVRQRIEYQLALEPAERQDARVFVRDVMSDMEALVMAAPPVGAAIRRRASARFGEADDPRGRLGMAVALAGAHPGAEEALTPATIAQTLALV
jgi:hypothetical protein